MPAIAVSMLAGLVAGFWLPAHTIAVSCGAGMTLLVALWLRLLPVLAFLAGCLLASLAVTDYLAARLPPELEGRDLLVSGCIVDIPSGAGRQQTFAFRIDAGAGWSEQPLLLRLAVYDDSFAGGPGDCFRLNVRLKQPHGTFNPGSFDRELWMFVRGIHASGYVRGIRATLPAAVDWQARLLRLRAALAQATAGLIPDAQIRPVVHGITLGLRHEFDAGLWDTFRRTGTAHLMAISGLHVGLVGLLGWGIGLGLSLLVRRTGPQLPAACSLLCAFVYALLGGWTLPTQRATIMAALTLVMLLRLRQAFTPDVVAFAAILVLAVWPAGIFTGGFWLSFLAIICLLLTATRYLQAGRLAGMLYPQFGLFVGLAIPGSLLFGGLSLVALPANIIAIPVFGLTVLPSALAATVLAPFAPAAAVPLLALAGFFLAGLLKLLAWLAEIPLAWVDIAPRFVVLMIVTAAMLVYVAGRLRPIILLTAAALCLLDSSPAGGLRITVIDVGQGLAVLLRTREHSLLYDAGAAWPGGDAGRSVIVPLLRYYGIGQLDALVVSHGDNDHRGGVPGIRAALPVGAVYVPLAGDHGGSEHLCRDGVRWQWDGVEFEFLHPRQPVGWSENNSSCVLRVHYGNSVILLPGDIEAAAERVLLGRHPQLRADLLLAPHHGSTTSSTATFVAAVRPAYVVYSTGYRNRWGFPAGSVAGRYEAVGACGLDTAETGALEFLTDGEGNLSLRPPAARSMRRPWLLRASRRPPCAGP